MSNPNVQLIATPYGRKRDDIERALLTLEQVDRDASNLLRNVIDSQESALRLAYLGGDGRDYDAWLYSWDPSAMDPQTKERIWSRIMAKIREERG